jgi:hypothetical protein
MENPDAVVEFKRDERGNIVEIALKASNDEKRTLYLCELANEALRSEGPEDHSTQVDVKVGFSVPS